MWSTDGGYFGHADNGSARHGGLIGLIQSNQADVCLLPFGFNDAGQYEHFLQLGPVLLDTSLAIMTTPDPKPNQNNPFLALLAVSDSVAIAMFTMVCIHILLMSRLEVRVNQCSWSVWQFYRDVVKQTRNQNRSRAAKTLAFVTLLAIFFWSQFWFNAFSSELFVIDSSSIVNSISDLEQSGIEGVFFELDPIAVRLKSDYRALWDNSFRITRENLKSVIDSGFVFSMKSKAFLGTELMIRYLAELNCGMLGQQANWIGRQKLLPVLYHPFQSKETVPIGLNKIIERRHQAIFESGLIAQFKEDMIETTKQVAPRENIFVTCVKTDLNQYLNEVIEKAFFAQTIGREPLDWVKLRLKDLTWLWCTCALVILIASVANVLQLSHRLRSDGLVKRRKRKKWRTEKIIKVTCEATL